jgi:hypothetical protein
MTKRELSQLYWLNREIEEQQRRIDELESFTSSCVTRITGMPHGRQFVDKLGEYAAEIADLRELLEYNLKRCIIELNRLNHYISTVEDCQMRMILSLRYVNGLEWGQVAYSIGSGYSAKSIQMMVKRFLEKPGNNSNNIEN